MKTFAVLFSLITVQLLATPTFASDMTFRFTSHSASPVLVELYSRDRLKIWPDDGRQFLLADSTPKKFSVSCELGEKICFGAWVEGNFDRSWGAGYEGKADCDDCCRICEIPAESPLYQVTFR